MLRSKRNMNLTAALATVLVLGLATLAEADFCLWCDPDMSQDFLLCVSNKLLDDPRFATADEALDDMKSSIMAASQAMKKSSESTKMQMMNGAMAGELAEMIKSQSSAGDLVPTTTFVLEIVRGCYVQTSGQEHYSFMQDVGKTVNFRLNGDSSSPGGLGSEKESVPYQYPAQAYGGQNIMAPNYVQKPQYPLTQPVSNVFIPKQMGVPPPSGVIPPGNSATYPQTGFRYPTNFIKSQSEATAVNLNYPSNNQNNRPFIMPSPNIQLQSAQANAASSYNSFKQNNWSNVAPVQNQWFNPGPVQNQWSNPAPVQNQRPNFVPGQNKLPDASPGKPISVPIINASKNSNFAITGVGSRTNNPAIAPNQFPPQKTGPLNFAASNSAAQTANAASSGFLFGGNLPIIGQGQFSKKINGPINNAATSYNFNDQRYQQNFVPPPLIPQPGSASAAGAATFITQGQRFPSYTPQNQLVPNSNSGNGAVGQNGAYPVNNVNQPPRQPDPTPAGTSSDYKNQPNYYNLNKPADNNSQPPAQPPPRDFSWNYPPLNNYPPPNNYYGTKNPAQSSSNNEPPKNPEQQPPQTIPQNPPPGFPAVSNANAGGTNSGGNGLPPNNPQPNNAVVPAPGGNPVSQPESSPNPKRTGDDSDIARAMRFAETVYVLCVPNHKFKSVFNMQTPKKVAASYTHKMIRGALRDCRYFRDAKEIANSCSDAVKSLAEKCSTEEYGEAISKSLMDAFYKKKLINENPENQAKLITTAFLARIKKRQSSEPLTAPETPVDSVPDYPAGAYDKKEYSLYSGDGDYPDYSKTAYGKEDYYQYPNQPKASQATQTLQKPEQKPPVKPDYPADAYGKKDYSLYNGDSGYPDYSKVAYGKEMNYYQYPNQQKANQAIQTLQKPQQKYPVKPDYTPNSQKNNDQTQQSTRKIVSPNDKQVYDGGNQNSNYDYYFDDYPYNYYDYNLPKSNYNQNNANYNPYYRNIANARPNQLLTTPPDIETTTEEIVTTDETIVTTTIAPTTTEGCVDDDSDVYPEYGPTFIQNNNQPGENKFPDSSSNEDGRKYSATSLAKPDAEKAERNERVRVLMEFTLKSISNGEFNYKVYSNVIAALAKYLQTTHPDWGSQKCFITILVESLVASTQLLKRIPPEILLKINVPETTDAADETMANWKTSSLKQENQQTPQPDEDKSAQNVQPNIAPQIPPEQNSWSSGYQNNQANPLPPAPNNAIQEGYTNSFAKSNANALNVKQENGMTNVPQSVAEPPQAENKNWQQQNNWNYEYPGSQVNTFQPNLNSNMMQQGYNNMFPNPNLNAPQPKQDSWINNAQQSEAGAFGTSSAQGPKNLLQQNNMNNMYQPNQGNSFPQLNNMQQRYGNSFQDSNFNAQQPQQGGMLANVPNSGGGWQTNA